MMEEVLRVSCEEACPVQGTVKLDPISVFWLELAGLAP